MMRDGDARLLCPAVTVSREDGLVRAVMVRRRLDRVTVWWRPPSWWLRLRAVWRSLAG